MNFFVFNVYYLSICYAVIIKVYNTGSLAVIFYLPVAILLMITGYVLHLRAQSRISKKKSMTDFKNYMLATCVSHAVLSLWVLIPAKDAGAWGYSYSPSGLQVLIMFMSMGGIFVLYSGLEQKLKIKNKRRAKK